jgi:hypothetical protein
MKKIKTCLLLTGLIRAVSAQLVLDPPDAEPLRFAAETIRNAARESNTIIPRVKLLVAGDGPAESYQISEQGSGWLVTAPDSTGALYGGIAIAEMLENMKETAAQPLILWRGISLQLDADESNDLDDWQPLLDQMALARLNRLTLIVPAIETNRWQSLISLASDRGIALTLTDLPQSGQPRQKLSLITRLLATDPTSTAPLQLLRHDFPEMGWYDPEFARTFINHSSNELQRVGFELNYPAPRFAESDPALIIWGRLAYHLNEPDLLFQHYARIDPSLDLIWRKATRIPPLINRFFQLPDWSTPLFSGQEGSPGLRDIIAIEPLPESRITSILRWAKQPAPSAITPLELADHLHRNATDILDYLETTAFCPDSSINKTANHLKVLAVLAQFYAETIRAACQLAQYDQSSLMKHLTAAIDCQQQALASARLYSDLYLSNTNATAEATSLLRKTEKELNGLIALQKRAEDRDSETPSPHN